MGVVVLVVSKKQIFQCVALILLHGCVGVKASSSSVIQVAPWQDGASVGSTASRLREAVQYQDFPHTVFAPGGRLHNIEAVTNAVSSESDPSSNTVIVIRCQAGVVAVTSLPLSPYAMAVPQQQHQQRQDKAGKLERKDNENESDENTSNTEELSLQLDAEEMGVDLTAVAPFCRVSLLQQGGPVLAVTAGNAADAQVLRHRLLDIAERVRAEGSDTFLVSALARRLADQNQVLTQRLGKGRVLAAAAVVFGCGDDDDDKAIWRIDPAGQFWKCQAVVSGKHAAVAEELLWQKIQQGRTNAKDDTSTLSRTQVHTKLSALSIPEALEMATQCIVEANAQKFNSDRSNNNAASRPNTILLRGISIDKDSRTIRSYSQNELVPATRDLN